MQPRCSLKKNRSNAPPLTHIPVTCCCLTLENRVCEWRIWYIAPCIWGRFWGWYSCIFVYMLFVCVCVCAHIFLRCLFYTPEKTSAPETRLHNHQPCQTSVCSRVCVIYGRQARRIFSDPSVNVMRAGAWVYTYKYRVCRKCV